MLGAFFGPRLGGFFMDFSDFRRGAACPVHTGTGIHLALGWFKG